MRSIEIVIDPTGEVKIEAVNFRGTECEKSTRFLEVALGTLKNRRRKPEYLIRVQGQPKQQVRG
jgi:hypothetical protein